MNDGRLGVFGGNGQKESIRRKAKARNREAESEIEIEQVQKTRERGFHAFSLFGEREGINE